VLRHSLESGAHSPPQLPAAHTKSQAAGADQTRSVVHSTRARAELQSDSPGSQSPLGQLAQPASPPGFKSPSVSMLLGSAPEPEAPLEPLTPLSSCPARPPADPASDPSG